MAHSVHVTHRPLWRCPLTFWFLWRFTTIIFIAQYRQEILKNYTQRVFYTLPFFYIEKFTNKKWQGSVHLYIVVKFFKLDFAYNLFEFDRPIFDGAFRIQVQKLKWSWLYASYICNCGIFVRVLVKKIQGWTSNLYREALCRVADASDNFISTLTLNTNTVYNLSTWEHN